MFRNQRLTVFSLHMMVTEETPAGKPTSRPTAVSLATILFLP